MALSAFLLSLLAQEPSLTTQVAPSDTNAPLVIAEPNRLALTPRLDGVMSDEEWDPFADTADTKSYLEWEPGKLHIAAVVPKGQDLIVSIDTKDDGWLRGKDNVEMRASLVGEKTTLKARVLDATRKEGPAWVDAPELILASEAVAKEGENGTFYELTIADPLKVALSPDRDSKYGFRYDVVPTGSADTAAFVPRSMSEINLVTQRNAGMPKGLWVGIQNDFPTVVPGENVRLRVTFKGTNALQLQKIELRSEGEAKDSALVTASPFPFFDSKGRAFVDYDTRIAPNAAIGYRIMRATVTAGDGVPGIVQGSYRISPLLDFILRKNRIEASENTRTVRLYYAIRSNSVNHVVGGVAVELPEGWRNLSTPDRGYVITQKNYILERHLDIEVPGGIKGTFPIKLRSVLGDTQTSQTVWVTVA